MAATILPTSTLPPVATAAPRVALYLRISKDSKRGTEEEGEGIERQDQLCRAVALRRGWTVDDSLIFRDNDVSATKSREGKEWKRMLAAIDAGRVDVVLCYALDRLVRRPIELETLIEKCDPRKVRVISERGDVSLNDGNTSAETTARIMAAIARQEMIRKGERQKAAEAQAREDGMPPRRYSFGYRPGGMETVPDEAAAIRAAYRYVRATQGRGSLAKIARRWNERGLRTKFGKEWEHVGVKSVLLNPRNAAIRTYQPTADSDRAEVGKGTWPAIVDEDTFRTVVALLTDPDRRRTSNSGTRKWVGAGLYRCGVCGQTMVSDRASDTKRRVYRCRTKHLNRVAEPIDALVFATIEERLSRPDAAELVTVDEPEDALLRESATVLRAQIRRLENDYGDGEIPARVWKEQTARKSEELARVESRRADMRRASALAPVLSAADPVAAFRALDVDAQSAFIGVLVDVTICKPTRRVFDPASVRIEWRTE